MAQHQSHSMPAQWTCKEFSDFLSLFLVPLSFPSLAFPWGPFSVAATLPILATVMDMSSKDTRPQHQDINHFQKGQLTCLAQSWMLWPTMKRSTKTRQTRRNLPILACIRSIQRKTINRDTEIRNQNYSPCTSREDDQQRHRNQKP